MVANLKAYFEEEKSNIDKEKYKRKKRFEKVSEAYNELKKADKKISIMDHQKIF